MSLAVSTGTAGRTGTAYHIMGGGGGGAVLPVLPVSTASSKRHPGHNF